MTDLGVPLELQQESRASSQIVRGNSVFLSRLCRGIGPLHYLQWETRVSLEIWQKPWGSSQVSVGNLGFL